MAARLGRARAGEHGSAPDARPPVATQLLALLGAAPLTGATPMRPDDWTALADAAARHGVMPLAWHRLEERGAAALAPPEVRRPFEAALLLAGLRAEAWRVQLDEILAVLRAHDIPVVLLKGADVAVRLYRRPALRPLGDLDLLVPDGASRAAAAALATAGYPAPGEEEWAAFRSHRHAPPIERRGRLTVELHETIDPWAPPFRETMRELWARVQPSHAEGAYALAPEDLLFHLTTHMGRNHLLGSSLVRVCDVAWWIGCHGAGADWDAVARRARDHGPRRFVATGLALAQRLLGAEVPAAVARALHEPGDDGVVADAEALLDASPVEIAGAVTLTQRDRPFWRRLGRLARMLGLLPPARRSPAPAGAAAPPAWRPRARSLLDPTAAGGALRRLAQVRRLRGWAEDTG